MCRPMWRCMVTEAIRSRMVWVITGVLTLLVLLALPAKAESADYETTLDRLGRLQALANSYVETEDSSADPIVLMTAYAVRGLDINTSYTIYHLLNEQKKKGVAVIYVGEDLDVLLELCDRILVLCGGKVSGIVDGRKTTKDAVGLMMTKIGG